MITTPHYAYVKEIEITAHNYQPRMILAKETLAMNVPTLLLHSAVKSLNQGH